MGGVQVIAAYDDGVAKLLHGDCRDVPAPREPYALVTDPPFTIRCAKHVDEMLASFGWTPVAYVVLTNPAHGYVTAGEAIEDEDLRPIGGAPTFERALSAMLRLIPRTRLLVFDPFAGTSTTLLAARAAGVRSVGIERSDFAVELGCRRLRLAAQS